MEKRGSNYIKILVLLIFFIPFCMADVNTSVEIENSAPVLTEEIPNVSCATNENLEDVYDLDDYFKDPNGQKLEYFYSGGENLTVEINNRSMVSIYPDYNYEGTSEVVFYASDGEYNASSNRAYINVGVDKEPPKWSNPGTSSTNVYQNDDVDFYSNWTDNFQLDRYIFSIKQEGSWTNDSSVSFSGKENVSEARKQISAPAGTTVYWRFYAFDTSGNSNSTDIQQLQVEEEQDSSEDPSEEPSEDQDFEESLEDYVGDMMDDETEKEKSYDYTFDPNHFKVSLKKGDTLTRVFEITNKGNTNISLDLSVSGISDLVTLSEKSLTLDFGESKRITLEFNIEGTDPGQYFGKLNMESDIDKSIPLVVEVNEYELDFDISVNLSEENLRVNPGENITANITVENIKDIKETEATLETSIKDFYGNVYDTKKEQISFSSSYKNLSELKVPESANEGEYLFYAKVYNNQSSALDSHVFEVGQWIDVAAFLRTSSTFLLIFILSVFAVFLFLLHKKEKKKERVLNLYLMVSELRKLVKEGKMDKAVDLYVRMKSAYGEHVSEEDLNKERLKENIEKLSKKMKREVEKQSKSKDKDKKESEEPSEDEEETEEPEERKEESGEDGGEEKEEESSEEGKEESDESEEEEEEKSTEGEESGGETEEEPEKEEKKKVKKQEVKKKKPKKTKKSSSVKKKSKKSKKEKEEGKKKSKKDSGNKKEEK